jgi:hypothetical protein
MAGNNGVPQTIEQKRNPPFTCRFVVIYAEKIMGLSETSVDLDTVTTRFFLCMSTFVI